MQGCTGSVLRVGTVQVATKHGSVTCPGRKQAERWTSIRNHDPPCVETQMTWKVIQIFEELYDTNHCIYIFSSLKFHDVQLSVQGVSWQTCIHLSSHPPRWETVGRVSAWYNDGSDSRQESTNPKFLVWHRFAFSRFIAGPQNYQLQCNWICLMSWFVFLQTKQIHVYIMKQKSWPKKMASQ